MIKWAYDFLFSCDDVAHILLSMFFPCPQSQKFILIRDDFVFSPSNLTLDYGEIR